jgi:hypothetical protein
VEAQGTRKEKGLAKHTIFRRLNSIGNPGLVSFLARSRVSVSEFRMGSTTVWQLQQVGAPTVPSAVI